MSPSRKIKIALILAGAFALVYGAYFNLLGNVPTTVNNSLKTILDKTASGVSQVIQIENIKELQVSLPGPLKKVTMENDTPVSFVSITQKEILDATNFGRSQNGGMNALTLNQKLNASASTKLEDMFSLNYFEHTSPRGTVLSDVINDAEYEYIIIGENLAMGNFDKGSEIVDEWMKSPGHRANILNTQFTEIGIAVREGMYDGRRVWIAVQHFGAPLSLCDKVDAELKNAISAEEKIIDAKAGELDAKKAEVDSTSTLSPEYNERVDEYNLLAEEYNTLLQDLKKKISQYNSQVKKFNDCTKGI
jgi:uncharacterized protein YkwD